MALGPRGAAGLCSASRAKCHSGSGPSGQTLGVLTDMTSIFEATEPTPKNNARNREAFAHLSDGELAACASAQPDTSKGFVANQLLAERRAAREEEAAALAKDRHEELLRKIEQPHWTSVPGFWVGAIGGLSSVVAAVFAYLSYAQQLQSTGQTQPSTPAASSARAPATSLPPQRSSPASQTPGL